LVIFSRLFKNWIKNTLLDEQNKQDDVSFSPKYSLVLNIVDDANSVEKKKVEVAELLKLDSAFGKLVLLSLAFEGKQKDFFYQLLKRELFPKTNIQDVITVQVMQQVLNERYIFDFVLNNLDRFVDVLDAENVYALAKNIMLRDTRKFNEVRTAFVPKIPNKVYRTVLAEVLDYVMIDSSNSVDFVRLLLKPLTADYTTQDVTTIAHWVNNKTEQMLLAICAGSENQEVVSSALGFLMLKYNYLAKDTSHVMSWIKKKKININKAPISSACKLSLSQIWSKEELSDIIDDLETFRDAKKMLVGLLDSKNQDLVLLLLQKYHRAISDEKLIQFLQHDDKEMRILAVKGLEGSGNFVARRALSKFFMQEKDEDVLKVYREMDDFQ
jgi:hypothetical protein